MFKQVFARILGKASATATAETEVRVDSSGGFAVAGHVAHDAVDVGNPVKTGGVARTTNPTAVGDGDRVSGFHDDVGRVVNWPYQVRDLISTARVAVTAAGETTLFAGAASTFHDLVQIMGANESTNALTVSLRDATGGGVVSTLQVPANETNSYVFPATVPQNTAAAAWTVTVDDFVSDGTTTNGTITFTAIFVKNV